jgi:anion-transporting  ArsA/GET3 family ATPase
MSGKTLSLTRQLGRSELVVVTGKGGVGKTTLTALIGRALAASGRRVLLLETDPRAHLHHLLGAAPSDGAITPVDQCLWFQSLKPESVLARLVRERVPIARLARTIVAHPVFQQFAEGAPGLREMATLGHVLELARGKVGPAIEVVVLDAPATGHSVSLLSAPTLASEVLGSGPLGSLTRDVARLIADPERTGIVVATLAEEMPVQEALELVGLLRDRIQRTPQLLIVNALYPVFPRVSAGAPPALAPVLRLWRERRKINQEQLRRLTSDWPGPRLELPLLPVPRGPALVSALLEELAPGLTAGGSR